MSGNMKEKMREIRNIEDKYGLVLFRMGLTHLVDVGVRHLTEDNVEESIKQILAEGEADKANGIITFMTPQFRCEIVRCAAELAQFGIWELFGYIKKHVVVSG